MNCTRRNDNLNQCSKIQNFHYISNFAKKYLIYSYFRRRDAELLASAHSMTSELMHLSDKSVKYGKHGRTEASVIHWT
jgi:hypothetical protein